MRSGIFLSCGCGVLVALSMLSLSRADDSKTEKKPVTVFESGEQGYHTFRIPAIVKSKQGTLLAFCEGRKDGRADHGNIDMVLKRSTDGGQTWGPLQIVHEEGGEAKITIGNPAPVVDQSTGMVWLPFCRDNDRVFVTSSTDDGQSWTKPKEITSSVKADDWTWYATGPVHGIQLTRGEHKGRLLIPCDHRVAKGPWEHKGRSHMIYSDDHGKTWQRGEPTDWAMNECTIAELADGEILLNMRSYRKQGCRAVATSKDGGVTWSECRDEPELPEPVCQGSLLRINLEFPDNSLPTFYFCNPASSKSRDHLTLRVYKNVEKAWSKGIVLCAGSSAYSDLVELPDETIGVLYERDDYKRIVFDTVSAWALMKAAADETK